MHTHIYIDLKNSTLELYQCKNNQLEIIQKLPIEDYIEVFVNDVCIFKAEQKPNEPEKCPIRTNIRKTNKKVQRKTSTRKNATTRKTRRTKNTKWKSKRTNKISTIWFMERKAKKMIKNEYSIKDTKVGFGNLFEAPNNASAIRYLADCVQDENNPLRKHAEDFQLFYMGEFDDQTGEFKSNVVFLENATAFKNS